MSEALLLALVDKLVS